MAQGIEYIPNAPIVFGATTPGCGCKDPNGFCQHTLLTDEPKFQFIASECNVNVVANPSFVATLVPWTGTNWIHDVSDGAEHTPGSISPLNQVITATVPNATYRIKYTIRSRTAGGVNFNIDGNIGKFRENNGTFEEFIVSINSGTTGFLPTTDFDGIVDDVEVFEVNEAYAVLIKDQNGVVIGRVPNSDISQVNDIVTVCVDWDGMLVGDFTALGALEPICLTICVVDGCDNNGVLNLVTNGTFDANINGWTGTNWAASDPAGCAEHTAGSTAALTQVITLQAGKSYRLTYDVVSRTAGSITPAVGGTSGTTVSTNGTFTELIVAAGNDITFTPTSAFDGCIDNVILTLDESELVCDEESNCFNLQSSIDCSVLLAWDNDENAFGFFYSSGFQNTMRIVAELRRFKSTNDKEFDLDSGGLKKLTFGRSTGIRLLGMEPMAEYMFEALALAIIHDNFFIDTVLYETEDDVDPDYSPDSLLAPAVLEVQKSDQPDKQNYNC